MTNFDYIKDNIKEIDIAYFLFPHDLALRDRPKGISERIYGAWDKWAESASSNKGNMAAGIHGKTIINEDPSIWHFQDWCYPDGKWRRKGRNHTISMLVWLSKQYDPEDWIEED